MVQINTQPDHRGLVQMLLDGLCQPTVRPGLRLKSEREISLALGLGRRRVAYAINRLVEQGVLIRRVGSGTFVRQIPDQMFNKPVIKGEARIAPELLYCTDQLPAPMADPADQIKPTRFSFGLCWARMDRVSRTNRLIFDAVMQRAEELGHRLSLHPIDTSVDNDPLAAGFLAQRIADQGHDGLIFSRDERFGIAQVTDILQKIGPKQLPMVYVFSASVRVQRDPLVYFDTRAAMERAIQILADAGHRKIGMIGLPCWNHVADEYDQVMKSLGLTYRAIAIGNDDWQGHEHIVPELSAIENGRKRAAELLALPDRPEAIYITDDVMALGVLEVLTARGLVPGRDIALISHSVKGKPRVPGGVNLSRLEFDPARLGGFVVDTLVDCIKNPDKTQPSLGIHAAWIEGSTHVRG